MKRLEKKLLCLPFFLLCFGPVATALAHGISAADKKAMLEGGNLKYLWLGATHMLTGYDHLLFLFGVIFFLTSFKDIVKFITVFTVGHSITLLFATLLKITANYYLVDAVIAVSVAYKGFENLDGFRKYLDMESPNLLWVVFGFGLIHGFGLSTRLQQLPLGDSGMVMRILSFNLGVEMGQVAALVVMLGLVLGWRRTASFQRFSTVSNFGLILAGGFLFLMQMHSYAHTMYPDEFGFNKDEHHHDHVQMKQRKAKAAHGHTHGKGSSHSHGAAPKIRPSQPRVGAATGHKHKQVKGASHGHAHDKGSSHEHTHRKKPVRKRLRRKSHGHSHGRGTSHGHAHNKGSSHGRTHRKKPARKRLRRKSHGHSHGRGSSHSHGAARRAKPSRR